MTTFQKTLVTATLAAAIGTGIYEARQVSRLRGELQTLQQAPYVEQIAQLKSDNESLTARLAQSSGAPSLDADRLRELLRLRGEVGVLRRQQRELELAMSTAQSKTQEPGRPPVGAVPQPNKRPPFQVQLVLDKAGDNTETIADEASSAGGETLHVQKTPLLDSTAVTSAAVTRNAASGAVEINVEFSQEGKELFAAITRENINKRFAIVLDGHVYAAPVVRSEISGGMAQITGAFTEEEARVLATKINDAVSGL